MYVYIHHHTCLIQMYSHLCVHKHTCIHMISVFPEFPYFCKSGNLEIPEIQKSQIMYICRQACMFVCMNGDGNRIDPPLTTTTPVSTNKPCVKNVFICEHNSEGDGYGVDPPVNHQNPLKDQKIYTIINLCVFLSTIQKAMDIEWALPQPPLPLQGPTNPSYHKCL